MDYFELRIYCDRHMSLEDRKKAILTELFKVGKYVLDYDLNWGDIVEVSEETILRCKGSYDDYDD